MNYRSIKNSKILNSEKRNIHILYSGNNIPNKDSEFLIIKPSNIYKKFWDLWICIVLIFSCIEIPYRLVFISGDDDLTW